MSYSRDSKLYTILNDIGIKTATFTAAVTDIITASAHGLKNGDMVILTTSGTLPAGLSLSTIYYVVQKTTNTFKLSITSGREGGPVDITTTESGDTHTFTMHDIGNSIFVGDFRNIILTLNTDGGGDTALTVKFQGSIQEDAPDFSAAQTDTNQWDVIQVKDLEDGSTIDGDTGIASTTDQYRQVEMNTNALRWVNCIISGWTEGEVTVKALLTDNQ